MTTFDEFASELLKVYPHAMVDENDYEIVVYTGMHTAADGNVIPVDYDDDYATEPRCDICGHPEWEYDYPELSSNNWNGETGNHRSCEEKQARQADDSDDYADMSGEV